MRVYQFRHFGPVKYQAVYYVSSQKEIQDDCRSFFMFERFFFLFAFRLRLKQLFDG